MKSNFVHLHTHSHYSLLNALPKIDELVDRAKKLNMPAIALTDNGNLYGAIHFYIKCKEEGIKPIIGVDFYVANRTRHDKEARIDNQRYRLILLAKNINGYKNLIKLVTQSHIEGFYYKPRIDLELIKKYSQDLICISPAFGGEISNALRVSDYQKAKKIADFYTKNYGEENFYIELCHHPEIEEFALTTEKIKKFTKENNLNLVATQDIYYMEKDDKEARRTLLSIQSSFGNDSSFARDGADFSFIDQNEIANLFKDEPEAISNTIKIADQCNLEIEIGKWKFPDYKTEDGLGPDETLEKMAYDGLDFRKMEKTQEVEDRIRYELEIIKTKGYSKYFLTVADMLNAARKKGILSNTRGSAAGSLVSYLVGITTVDPIKLNLPFERFLNPERPSAPDIDMDLADDRRDELIDYVREKYGKDHVAQIGTFGTMMARGSVRDVARAMGYEYSVGDRISKMIPMGKQGFPMTIDRALSEVPELKKMYDTEPDTKKIIDMAKKIEGCARHIGVHAAGVVISPDPLTEDVPLQFDPKGEAKLITQYDMYTVGEDGIGLLKFDFLGLKNLTIMANTIKLAEKLYNIKIDIEHLPDDDKKTYEMLAKGETAATFQLNGQGMTKFLKELKPTNINDINAMVALYRPGPMAFIPDYIERKHNSGKVKYLDERFKEILEPTFGILIYQDDIMMIAVKFAGYSWGEADKFRKAMGKKIPEVMAAQKQKFSEGCQKYGGLNAEQTKKLWESIETFAAYGFNKAHAASYGRVAYLTSYLKANYPVLYMASVLTADSGDVEKIAEIIEETKRMGIEVLPPDINESFSDFTVVTKKDENQKDRIRFGLTTIKNFGEGIANTIIEERKKNGNFKSLEDFLHRINDKNLNKKSLEALIKSGALDNLGDRSEMLYNLEEILSYSKESKNNSKNQASLFDSGIIEKPKLKLQKAEQISDSQKLSWEKELLGLYISGHPLEKFKEKLQKGLSIKDIKIRLKNGMTCIAAGHVDEIKIIRTKNNSEMAFIKISDMADKIEIVVFPKIFEEYKNILMPQKCIAIKGRLSERNGDFSVVADKIKEL
ncbi:MAG TPA: DNA polymerase III subunit alpha [Candidatus Paceibacterota bacterium]|nr:DNA polymerase III subunit alpha [Candidatus Paceibacterota bacterium]HMP18807.1 DNA polymerase III subunit alpha [Candidatus Paceibacterota bacterium]HMP85302.1 DNA polymerase III subunit alpha [Candidatus Paceibacterota bacterium]